MRSEVERLIGKIIRDTVRESPTPEPFLLPQVRFPANTLPSYNGEMGFEVCHFLARVEPYLRNGWRILARRPELYPSGAAFFEPEYFAALDGLIARYKVVPCGVSARQAIHPEDSAISIPAIQRTGDAIGLALTHASVAPLWAESRFELDLRDLFFGCCDADDRGLVEIDELLLSCHPSRFHEGPIYANPVLVPSYHPPDFTAPAAPARPHVGVQLRAMKKTGKHPGDGESRDSDPGLVMPRVEAAARHLGLPILVYGHPAGTFFPDGYERSHESVENLLATELRLLSGCRVMFAPDSGWADLMAWLRIPTMVEKAFAPAHWGDLAPFRPRMMLTDGDRPIAEQIDELLAADQRLAVQPMRGRGRLGGHAERTFLSR